MIDRQESFHNRPQRDQGTGDRKKSDLDLDVALIPDHVSPEFRDPTDRTLNLPAVPVSPQLPSPGVTGPATARAAAQNGPTRAVCNSTQNAVRSVTRTRLVRVTHPFYPPSGCELICVGERYNRYGMRLLLRVDEETVCSVPPQWTDLVAPDPEIVIGEGRARFRLADLVKLARLMARLGLRELLGSASFGDGANAVARSDHERNALSPIGCRRSM